MGLNLSPREGELLKLLLQGQSNKEIAKNMRISCATVKQYLRSLFLKFSVENRTQLAITAITELGHAYAKPSNDKAIHPTQMAVVSQNAKIAS
jgi:DNA-binding CsgD family transcriptional regulator